MRRSWVPLAGTVKVEDKGNKLLFEGRTIDWIDDSGLKHSDGSALAHVLSNDKFTGGTISAKITFEKLTSRAGAGLTIARHPGTDAHLTVVLGNGGFCGLRFWVPPNQQRTAPGSLTGWNAVRHVGDESSLEAGRTYELAVTLQGSRVTIELDAVKLIETNLQENIVRFAAGAWFFSKSNIVMNDIKITSAKMQAFVVMEFSKQFDDLYSHVIKPICDTEGIKPIRADEQHGPGIIIADIERSLVEANVIIADVTPVNANVFYEVGYAHALRKPTILLAQQGTKLPFDISGFRTIFYENTIDGKSKIERGLRLHLQEVFGQAS